MNKSPRFFLLAAALLAALALSAYGVALAAPDLTLNSLLSNFGADQSASTETAVASATPEVQESDSAQSTDSPELETETPEVQSTESPEAQSTETPEVESTETPDPNEVSGAVTAFDATSITIDGVVYTLADFTEIKGTIQLGDNVKIELMTGPDGTLIVREIKTGDFLSGDHSGPGGQDGSGHDAGDISGDVGDDHGGGSKP